MPIHRNLDRPFRVFGFSPIELAILSLVLVGGGELAEALSLNRIWAFLLTLLLAGVLYGFRRSLGEMFGARLWRFLQLPDEVHRRLMFLE